MAVLCRLIEQDETRVSPDAVWLGDQSDIFHHLQEMGALSLSAEVAKYILCPECGTNSIQPVADRHAASSSYRAHCIDCGWVDLKPDQARWWVIHPRKAALWLQSALRLGSRAPEMIIEGILWHLGSREYRRQQKTFFFARRLADMPQQALDKISELAAASSAIVITTTDTSILSKSAMGAVQLLPLRATFHIRKSHFVAENLDSYLSGVPAPVEVTVAVEKETSLRRMKSARLALIDGIEHPLSPQVAAFLTVLVDAEGDDVMKGVIADRLNLPRNFKVADIIKRHRVVFDTFTDSDSKGRYWLRPEYVVVHDSDNVIPQT
jgi:hypothetical protein